MSIKIIFPNKQAEDIFWSTSNTFKHSNRSKHHPASKKKVDVARSIKQSNSWYSAFSLFAKFTRHNNKSSKSTATPPQSKTRRRQLFRRRCGSVAMSVTALQQLYDNNRNAGGDTAVPNYTEWDDKPVTATLSAAVRPFDGAFSLQGVDTKYTAWDNKPSVAGSSNLLCFETSTLAGISDSKFTGWDSKPVVVAVIERAIMCTFSMQQDVDAKYAPWNDSPVIANCSTMAVLEEFSLCNVRGKYNSRDVEPVVLGDCTASSDYDELCFHGIDTKYTS